MAGYVNTSSLFRAAVPQRSYAQLAAQKDRELQLGAVQEERARLSQQENQARIQQQQDVVNQLKNLPLEAPDKQRVKMWVGQKQKDLAKYIRENYAGQEGKFFEAESQMWMKNTLNDLLSSDLYAVAQSNKENVAMAKEAMKNQENLTGTFDQQGRYVPAENQLLAFMQGKNPTFQFNGSYKPDAQSIYDHFGKLDNPYGSKYDKNAFAPEQDVLTAVTAKYGDKNGRDLFIRQFQGRQVPFKRYSLEDQLKFNSEQANRSSLISSRQQANARGWASIDIQRQKLAAANKEDQQYEGLMENYIASPVGTTPYQPISSSLSQPIKTIGKKIEDLTVSGKSQGALNFENYSGVPLGATKGLEFTEYPGSSLSKLHDKIANLAPKTGQAKEGILSDGTVLDLTKIKHRIASTSPSIFVDQAETNRIAEQSRISGGKVYPDHEFRKATIIVSPENASSIPKNSPDVTPIWVDKKDDDKKDYPSDREREFNGVDQILQGYKVEIMSPSKGFFKNREVQQIYNKSGLGQKRANEIFDQQPVVDEFISPSDSAFE